MKIEMIFLFFLGDYVIDKIKMIDYIYKFHFLYPLYFHILIGFCTKNKKEIYYVLLTKVLHILIMNFISCFILLYSHSIEILNHPP